MGSFAQHGFAILDLEQLEAYERSTADLSNFEDASNQHKKHHRKHRGTQQACQLSCEKGLPLNTAPSKKILAYNTKQAKDLQGGFDPLQLIRKRAA